MIYLDSSAIVRLISEEEWSAELDDYLNGLDPNLPLVTSAIGFVEVRRVLLREEADAVTVRRAESLLALFERVELTETVIDEAGRLPDRYLRSLDAIHVASALQLVPGLTVLLSYDKRMLRAARGAGLPVAAPGMAF